MAQIELKLDDFLILTDSMMGQKSIFLVGFMGSGKSTVGKGLASALQKDFIDLDDLIVSADGRMITDIFMQSGETYFRQLESRILFSLHGARNAVIALGGGTFCQSTNMLFVKQNGISIWLNCSLDAIMKRMPLDGSRPLIGGSEQVADLLIRRIPHYCQADIQIESSNLTVEETIRQIISLLTTRN